MIFKRIFRWIGYLIIFFLVSSIGSVVILKFLPVYYTPLMVIRCVQQVADGRSPKIEHKWVPLSKINHNLPQAVVASEDNRFLTHHGFDFEEIYKARLDAMHGGKERGASTISQQTAKNVFLWPGHSWIRKGFEAYFTVLIELIWGKERIMEVYLNSIEMGDGIYGAYSVAHINFDKEPGDLTKRESALIAISLPNPLERNTAHPTGNMQKMASRISKRMSTLKEVPFGKKN